MFADKKWAPEKVFLRIFLFPKFGRSSGEFFSKFHFARFTRSCPPNTSVFLLRPLTPLHPPRPRPASPVPRPFIAPASPGPRPALAWPSLQAIWPSKRAKEKFTRIFGVNSCLNPLFFVCTQGPNCSENPWEGFGRSVAIGRLLRSTKKWAPPILQIQPLRDEIFTTTGADASGRSTGKTSTGQKTKILENVTEFPENIASTDAKIWWHLLPFGTVLVWDPIRGTRKSLVQKRHKKASRDVGDSCFSQPPHHHFSQIAIFPRNCACQGSQITIFPRILSVRDPESLFFPGILSVRSPNAFQH